MILVDSSVWVDFFRGVNSRQRQILHNLIENEEDIAITEIILTEVLQGVRDDKYFQSIKEYLSEFPIIKSNGINTYVKSAQIYRDCRRKGKTIRKTIDCIIAEICIENNLILLHKDSDFKHIESCTDLKYYKI